MRLAMIFERGMVHKTLHARRPAADLGMFSMFGRSGAPTKMGPTRGAANFLHAGNNGRYPSERVKMNKSDSDDQKRSPVFFQE